MADEDKSMQQAHGENLVKLHINQSSNSQAWTRFMILIQSGLGAALGILLLKEPQSLSRTILVLLVSLFGACTSFIIGLTLRRHHQWAAWYVNKYRLLYGGGDGVYPKPKEPFKATEISQVKSGYIGRWLTIFCAIVGALWVLIFIITLCRLP